MTRKGLNNGKVSVESHTMGILVTDMIQLMTTKDLKCELTGKTRSFTTIAESMYIEVIGYNNSTAYIMPTRVRLHLFIEMGDYASLDLTTEDNNPVLMETRLEYLVNLAQYHKVNLMCVPEFVYGSHCGFTSIDRKGYKNIKFSIGKVTHKHSIWTTILANIGIKPITVAPASEISIESIKGTPIRIRDVKKCMYELCFPEKDGVSHKKNNHLKIEPIESQVTNDLKDLNKRILIENKIKNAGVIMDIETRKCISKMAHQLYSIQNIELKSSDYQINGDLEGHTVCVSSISITVDQERVDLTAKIFKVFNFNIDQSFQADMSDPRISDKSKETIIRIDVPHIDNTCANIIKLTANDMATVN